MLTGSGENSSGVFSRSCNKKKSILAFRRKQCQAAKTIVSLPSCWLRPSSTWSVPPLTDPPGDRRPTWMSVRPSEALQDIDNLSRRTWHSWELRCLRWGRRPEKWNVTGVKRKCRFSTPFPGQQCMSTFILCEMRKFLILLSILCRKNNLCLFLLGLPAFHYKVKYFSSSSLWPDVCLV